MSIQHPETVSDLKPEVVDELAKLYLANIDSAEGFTEAGKGLQNAQLAEKFQKWAQQRREQAAELERLVELNHEEVDSEGSWLAALHRSYTALKVSLASNEDHVVLAEAERGEDQIKEAYEEVLKATPGTAVNDLLQHQYAAVKATHDKLRGLRDASRK